MEMLVRCLTVCSLVFVLLNCKKKEEEVIPVSNDNGGIVYANYPKNSIVSLHANIFAPTCANSGCHDGTFSPDFRTIQSTYNTLVKHPVVKNNANNDYTYRVVPGDANKSVLYNRLIEDIDGQSGIMPLYSGDAWEAVKQTHINNIVSWINNGAKDMFDNPYLEGNQAPQMLGFMGIVAGSSTPLPRQVGGPIEIPENVSNMTLWFSFKDDQLNASQLSNNKLKFSSEIFDFESASEQTLLIDQSISGIGYFNEQVTYTHRIQIDPSVFPFNESVFIRVYVSDGENNTEIPSDGSPNYIKLYFSIKRV